MNEQYKTDIIRKIFQFFVVIYFVWGFLVNYAWTSKELDYRTKLNAILRFWDPVAITMGLFNILNFILILLSLKIRISYPSSRTPSESNILLFSLTIPLFLATIVYVILKLIAFSNSFRQIVDYTIIMLIGEMLLFSGTMFLLVNLNNKNKIFNTNLQREFVNFVILVTAVGMANYLMFHMISQQVENFISVASDYSIYSAFYGRALTNRTTIYFKMDKLSIYLQPIAILYCCISVVYLIMFLNYNSSVKTHGGDFGSISEITDLPNQELHFDSMPVSYVTLKTLTLQSLRVPPLSLVLGIIFITITLLVLTITIPLINSNNYSIQGQLLSTLFPIPIYILSIVLLCLQVNEMERWPRSVTNKYMIDKMLIWIGASGQFMLSAAQILLNSYQNMSPLSICKIVSYIILIFQTVLQTITMGLALERKWISPEHRTWQDYICPAVGMLSINLGFLFMSLFDSVNVKSLVFYTNFQHPHLFIRIFENGFQYFGLTLGTFQRLHSSLIFGKMAIYTNQ